MPQPKSPRNIVITGASSGIGLAIAEASAERGYALMLGARRLDRLESLIPELKERGASAVHVAALDVCDDQSCQQFAEKVQKTFAGHIDVLCNNAGLALGAERVADGDFGKWEQMLDTNVMGVLRVTRRLLPAMIAQGKGHIVMTGSIAAHQVYEGGSVYCASKHALRAITQTLKLEINGTGLRVSSIDPGMVNTEFSLVRFKDHAKAERVYNGMTPLSAHDIADCVVFMIERPAHVNIDSIVLTPTDQASANKVYRRN